MTICEVKTDGSPANEEHIVHQPLSLQLARPSPPFLPHPPLSESVSPSHLMAPFPLRRRSPSLQHPTTAHTVSPLLDYLCFRFCMRLEYSTRLRYSLFSVVKCTYRSICIICLPSLADFSRSLIMSSHKIRGATQFAAVKEDVTSLLE